MVSSKEIMITLQQIRDHQPCEDGWKKVFKANGGDMTTPFPLKSILDSNDLNDCLWALHCLPEYNNLWRLYAVWCARQVEHLMTDSRSKAALDVAERFAKGDATQKELTAARAAAGAAREDAISAAISAAWAVRVASDVSAERAAKNAARAASDVSAACAACAAAIDAWAASDVSDAASAASDVSAASAACAAAIDAWAASDVSDAASAAASAAQKAKLIEILRVGEWV